MPKEEANPFQGKRTLDTFYPGLAQDPRVRAAFEEDFPETAEQLLELMSRGETLEDIEEDADDILFDLIQNEGDCVEAIDCWGAGDEFQVNICAFGPVFWIQAPEFDDIGFFASQAEAVAVAEVEYDTFIAEYNEHMEEEEEEVEEDDENDEDEDDEDEDDEGEDDEGEDDEDEDDEDEDDEDEDDEDEDEDDAGDDDVVRGGESARGKLLLDAIQVVPALLIDPRSPRRGSEPLLSS